MTDMISVVNYCKTDNSFRKNGPTLSESVKRFAYIFFHNLSKLFEGKFGAFKWNFKHKAALLAIPPFFFRSPFLTADFIFPENFMPLIEEYKKINSINSDKEFMAHLNRLLKKGFCHAEATCIAHRMKMNQTSFFKEMEGIQQQSFNVLFLQIVEIFRASFQESKRSDLLNRLKTFVPDATDEISYGGPAEGLSKTLLQDFQSRERPATVRIYGESLSHTILLVANTAHQEYGFYNNEAGYYSFDSLEACISEFLNHVHHHHSSKHLNWEISFF